MTKLANTIVTDDLKKVKHTLANSGVHYYEFSHNLSYDTELASLHFDDFVDETDGVEKQFYRWHRGRICYLVIYGDGVKSTDNYFKISHLRAMRKSDLYELRQKLDYMYCDIEEYNKEEIIDELMQVSYAEYYDNYFANTDYNDLDSDYHVTGYSQGDVFKVKIVGKNPYGDNVRDYLRNIFYDSPISGSIDVTCNGELVNELYADEMLGDPYEYWDKYAIIEKVKSITADEEYNALLVSWLENRLPSALDYSG